MGTAEPLITRKRQANVWPVSIRCREMGPAEPYKSYTVTKVYCVSIRCREMGTAERVRTDGEGPALPERVSIRCREMGTAERPARPDRGRRRGVSIRCREMGTAERENTTTC